VRRTSVIRVQQRRGGRFVRCPGVRGLRNREWSQSKNGQQYREFSMVFWHSASFNIRCLQHIPFYEKPISVQIATFESDNPSKDIRVPAAKSG
jgi:hypothetical protein